MAKKTVGIVGAGYTGLAAGYYLQKRGFDVTIFEASSDLGGLAGSFGLQKTFLEKYYHHMFKTDRELLEIIAEVGLKNDIVWQNPKSATYYDGKIYDFRGPIDLLKFKPLSFFDRVKLGAHIAGTALTKKWQHLDKITAKSWVEKKTSKKVYEVMWKPLMDSKFGKWSDKVAAAWLWSRFKARAESRDKTGKEMLGYIKNGGYQKFTQALADKIAKKGGKIYLNSAVSNIFSTGKPAIVVGGKKYSFDSVLFTASPNKFAKIARDLPKNYQKKLESVIFQGNICLTLVLDKGLSNVYWLNVNDLSFPFVAVIEHTNFIEPKNYGGKHIIYLSRYIDPSDQLFSASPAKIEKLFISELAKIFPDIKNRKVIASHLYRDSESQPVPLLNNREKLPPLETPLKNVYLASMAQIYPADRGMNFSIKLARDAVSEISKI